MVAAAAAFLSKEPAIVLPAVLVAWEMTRARPERRPAREMVLRLLPIVMVAIGSLAIRHLVLGSVGGRLGGRGPGCPTAWPRAWLPSADICCSWWRRIPPLPTSSSSRSSTWGAWSTVASLAAIAGLAAACALAWRRSRIPAFLLAWFVLTLLPSTPLMPVGPVHMAERFLYLPSAAFALALGWAAARAARARGAPALGPISRGRSAMRTLLAAGGVALLLVGGLVLTLYRNEDWRDAERLFTRMAESSPRSWKAANGLGHVYEDRGQLPAAAMEYRRAMALRPGAVAPVISLALVESRMGLHEQAKRRAEDARRLDPAGGRGAPDRLDPLQRRGA